MKRPSELRAHCLDVVEEVRALPYRWPGAPDADAAERDGFGTCASKHALLARRLFALGIDSAPLIVLGRLVPELLVGDEDLAAGVGLFEVHECLTVLTPWAGPLVVDVTWDPLLVRRGLPGALDWTGESDMPFAIGRAVRAWAVPRDGFRTAKEAIRARLYRPEERRIRDRCLGRLSEIFASWRREG